MLKETVDKISLLTSKFINEFNREKSLTLSAQIEDCIADLLIQSDTKFVAILITKFLKPISQYIRQIEENPIGNSRSKKEMRKQHLQKLNSARLLRNSILIDYQDQLNNTEYFANYILEKGNIRDFIITPNYKSFPIEAIPVSSFKVQLLNSYKETKLYFKNISQTKPEYYKGVLHLFVDEVKSTVSSLNTVITKQTVSINELAAKIDGEVNNEGYHYLADVLFDRQQELTNHAIHKEYLEKLLDELYSAYRFLKTYDENRVIPLTVFGLRNFDAMKMFYNELKDFLEKTTSYSNIIQVFSLEYRNPITKINLVNGTLNDYAHLMNELEPYFIEELSERSNYNKWWSERFVFTTTKGYRVEKTKNTISTMRSNTRKDLSRISSKRTKINQIVQTISIIPQ